jgi:NarL family two-component system response regulator LiaR
MPPLPRPLRVAILNDYELIVLGVAEMLAPYADRIHVVELDTRVLVASDVDVVLFDTYAHVSGEGIELRDLVTPDGPKVVVFTWTTSPVAIEQALAAGACGYLSKVLSPRLLVEALEDICAGTVVASEPYQPMLTDVGSGDWPAHHFTLSARESEVVALIAKGMSNREIGATLYLSVNSIKTYIRTAYYKMGARSRSQAVLWAVEHGFLLEEGRRSILRPGDLHRLRDAQTMRLPPAP